MSHAIPEAALACLRTIAKTPGITERELAKRLHNGRVLPLRQSVSFLLYAGQICRSGVGYRVL